mmetsp:Transcript_132645/g.234556  ORF Transcript_132645/g.234556 Transcript_132645/m.234556 type:complete len:127 (-) Transcript_132645:133-513(-)
MQGRMNSFLAILACMLWVSQGEESGNSTWDGDGLQLVSQMRTMPTTTTATTKTTTVTTTIWDENSTTTITTTVSTTTTTRKSYLRSQESSMSTYSQNMAVAIIASCSGLFCFMSCMIACCSSKWRG